MINRERLQAEVDNVDELVGIWMNNPPYDPNGTVVTMDLEKIRDRLQAILDKDKERR